MDKNGEKHANPILKGLKIVIDDPKGNFQKIKKFIEKYLTEPSRAMIKTKNGNKLPLLNKIIFGVADASDPIFIDYKQVIHPEHWTPIEVAQNQILREGLDVDVDVRSVLVYITCLSEEIIKSNLREVYNVSEEWVAAKFRLNQIFDELGSILKEQLDKLGYLTFNPLSTNTFKVKKYKETWHHEENRSWASQFSLRHAAYAAGLGTFSLNDGFIADEGGIAIRIGAIITELELPIKKRTHVNYRENCLWYRSEGKKCGNCVTRCPVNAIEAKNHGHDKNVCARFVFGEMAPFSRDYYGIQTYACGKCQVGVPCTNSVPP